MHILLLNYEYPPLGGGAGIVSQQLAAEFINSGIPVTIITTWFEGLKEVETHGLLTIYRLKSLQKKTFQSNPIEMLSWCYHCILFLKKNKITTPNTVCLTNFLIPGGIVGYWLKRTTGV